MLDSDVDSLLNVTIADLFVDNDPDCGLCDVVDYTCFAMIDFVGHATETSASKY